MFDLSKAVGRGFVKVNGKKYPYYLYKNPLWDNQWGEVPESSKKFLPKGGYNGYVLFRKRPTIEEGYRGILTYVPVHGGITYANSQDGGMMYGFDTSHHDSDSYPTRNRQWIRHQIVVMTKGILMAKKYERSYLKTRSNKQRAVVAQRVVNVGKPKHQFNMGIALNLLGGRL